MCLAVCVTYSGIQLLEHEEVLFNYYEKVNIQEAAITKGNMMLETLEKEMRDLQLVINEEKRQIDLKKKEVPIKKKLEGDIAMLQIEVGKNVHINQDKPAHLAVYSSTKLVELHTDFCWLWVEKSVRFHENDFLKISDI